jgi:DNA-binding transcriptional ArsR family regulator
MHSTDRYYPAQPPAFDGTGEEWPPCPVNGDSDGDFGTSPPAVSLHLRVLRESGFVTVRPDGTRRLYAVEAAPLRKSPRAARHEGHVIDIGTRLEVLKDYPTPPNCTSPFAPTWITEMVRSQHGR